jgi:hypothetical protein
MPWTCEITSAKWQPRFQHTSVIFDNKMWVLGGENNGVQLNDVWYSKDGRFWNQAIKSAIWSKRACHTSVVFDKKIWVMGGRWSDNNNNYNLNDVWCSSNGKTWTQKTASAPWSARHYHTSLVYDGKMWIIGGYDGHWKNDVWYSSDGTNWVQATDSAPWSIRCAHSSVVFQNRMWVIGGIYMNDSGFVYLNDVWYSTNGKYWFQATDSAPWLKRYAHQTIVYRDMMWLMGGCPKFPSTHLNDIWFSTDGFTWRQATGSANWSPRKSFSLLSYNYSLWLFGGDTTAYRYGTNDVWCSEGFVKK